MKDAELFNILFYKNAIFSVSYIEFRTDEPADHVERDHESDIKQNSFVV